MDSNINNQKEYDSHESRIKTYKQEERRLNLVIKELTKMEKKLIDKVEDARELVNDVTASIDIENKKVAEKRKEVVRAEQALGDVKVETDIVNKATESSKKEVEYILSDIETKKAFYEEQIKAYHDLCEKVADELRETGNIKTSIKTEEKEIMRTGHSINRQLSVWKF